METGKKINPKPNRLAAEKSPYLLQHAYNPVDWHAWGAESFARAKAENKLVFLSIGYSTCHWCHVMERESFENDEVAELLNRDFISIKVDREERPDIDHIYMSAVQVMTRSGGWPLSVFLTPAGEPITGGTYFPPEDRWGRPGMKTILPRLAQMWKTEGAQMTASGRELTALLEKNSEAGGTADWKEISEKCYRHFEASFDEVNGGFGGAPKFPRSHELSWLLRYWKKTKTPLALEMVRKTLDAMAKGGIYDHLAGGFHRYATDEAWLVPHFEKMLYDQAMISKTYLEMFQASRDPFYADVARDIFSYVLRDMTDAEGGFYSAEDADSEGEEGKFCVWRPEEIKAVLGEEGARLFCDFYGVTDEGNFEHNASILNQKENLEDFAVTRKLNPAELVRKFQECRVKLFKVRKKRVPPLKDDKVLTAWNGLMISSLAYGAQVLEEPLYQKAAERAGHFIVERMIVSGRLFRRYRLGETAIPAFQDDYACLAVGFLDLYETSLDLFWLEKAKWLLSEMVRLFWDAKNGGFFYTANDAEVLVVRPKEYYDGAVPSGNSAALLALLRFYRMSGENTWLEHAEKLLSVHSGPCSAHPAAFPFFLAAAEWVSGEVREIVLAGNKEAEDFKNFRKILSERFNPLQSVLYSSDEEKERDRLKTLSPFAGEKKNLSGKMAAYICRNYVCQKPALTAEDFKKDLEDETQV